MSIIVIDPGHGGTKEVGSSSPNNAKGPKGTLEKTLTLDIGIRLRDVLQSRQHTVFLTRSTDINIGLAERAGEAKKQKAAVFVSIHFNGNDKPTVQGTETWVHINAGDPSKLLAAATLKRLLSLTNYRDRGVWAKGLGVLNPIYHLTSTAAALVEISFMTDPKDEERLLNTAYRQQLAEALTDGIEDFLAGRAIMPKVQVVATRKSASGEDIEEDI